MGGSGAGHSQLAALLPGNTDTRKSLSTSKIHGNGSITSMYVPARGSMWGYRCRATVQALRVGSSGTMTQQHRTLHMHKTSSIVCAKDGMPHSQAGKTQPPCSRRRGGPTSCHMTKDTSAGSGVHCVSTKGCGAGMLRNETLRLLLSCSSSKAVEEGDALGPQPRRQVGVQSCQYLLQTTNTITAH